MGINKAVITKLDVLDNFNEIKICVGYNLDGKKLKYFPSTPEELESVKPIYETLPGWKEKTSDIRNYEDLPKLTKKYLDFIAKHCGFEIKYVSVGL